MSLEELALHLPRNAFGPRETARAGDLWRVCQDAAVLGSSRRGWPPERYRAEGCAFVVRAMTVVHERSVSFGQAVTARTWVSTFRRGMLTDRQVRVSSPDGVVCRATQRWVHVSSPSLQLARASPELVDAFPLVVDPDDGDVALPAFTPVAEAPTRAFEYDVWHGWMDPLAHVNHPAYVDHAEEGIARILAARGVDPQALAPIAEEVTWKSGLRAPERVVATTTLVGVTEDGGAVTRHVFAVDGEVRAEATLIRSHVDPAALRQALA